MTPVPPAAAFVALHRAAAAPFLIPNAWDHASASVLAAQGFPAIGTTSLAVAAAAGLPDGAGGLGAVAELRRAVPETAVVMLTTFSEGAGVPVHGPLSTAHIRRDPPGSGSVSDLAG
ncbi:isocitrate lyase/phosphoenolpyruvate mutase family protein [Streptomyces atratus]|uniref:isocitrate lyase/phosphoenolpyruvate mutase family protein n=1 Tax=Streptomyces atratus TaxID=1893 RepID=UPI003F69799E